VNPEAEVLTDTAHRLETAGIPYMITGSVAANFYAFPRMTRDIDIVIEADRSDIDRLLPLFNADFYIDRDSAAEAVDGKSMFNVIHNEHLLKIDFIIRKDSAYRKLEFERRRKAEIEGVGVFIVSPEDLILSKLDWAKDSRSEMQLGDVKNLIRQVKNLDIPYIEKWVRSLGLETVYQMVKA